MGTLWSRIIEGLRSVWYENEPDCCVCGGNPGPICLNCENVYFHPELGRCCSCGKLISPELDYCRDCLRNKGPESLTRVWAWGHYSGDWKKFIWEVKFKAQPRRLLQIGRPLSQWVIGHLPPVDGIVPVPMHPDRLAERGFNQAEVIASLLKWELGLPLIKGLERKLLTVPQIQLTRWDRLQNLEGVFAVKEPQRFSGLSVWLVDDVITTGSTIEACARTLLENGARHVYGLSLAAGAEKGLVPYRE
jgi:ComF family protein